MTSRAIISCLMCLAVSGCATGRNTRLDHLLTCPPAPTLDLSRYTSFQKRPGQDPDLALAVAVSGGGHRAANFAMGVLLGLEQTKPAAGRSNVLGEIDYFSTVSGGGFAAGVYISTLHDFIAANSGAAGYSLEKALSANKGAYLVNLERDYQGSILEGFFHLRCLGYRDSGDLLERKFDRYMLGAGYRGKSLVLGDIFKPAESGSKPALPCWTANSTVYQNGVRFLFTPGMVEKYGIEGYTHNMKHCRLKGDPFKLPLAVAVKSSASFPVAIPATTFTCRPGEDSLNRYLHLLDGGLVDNLGITTAFELLAQDRAKKKVLLVINAYKGGSFPYSAGRVSPSGVPVAYRIMKISLDTEQSRLRSRVSDLEESTPGEINVIYLDFEQLKPQLKRKMQSIEEELARLRKERAKAFVRRARREIDTALNRKKKDLKKAEDEYALYHDARAVMTSLNITRAEQNLLLEAGRKVVDRNRELIEQSVFGSAPGPE